MYFFPSCLRVYAYWETRDTLDTVITSSSVMGQTIFPVTDVFKNDLFIGTLFYFIGRFAETLPYPWQAIMRAIPRVRWVAWREATSGPALSRL